MVALWTAFGLVMTPYLLRHDPELLAERMKLVPLHKDQKVWDKVIMLLFFISRPRGQSGLPPIQETPRSLILRHAQMPRD